MNFILPWCRFYDTKFVRTGISSPIGTKLRDWPMYFLVACELRTANPWQVGELPQNILPQMCRLMIVNDNHCSKLRQHRTEHLKFTVLNTTFTASTWHSTVWRWASASGPRSGAPSCGWPPPSRGTPPSAAPLPPRGPRVSGVEN